MICFFHKLVTVVVRIANAGSVGIDSAADGTNKIVLESHNRFGLANGVVLLAIHNTSWQETADKPTGIVITVFDDEVSHVARVVAARISHR